MGFTLAIEDAYSLAGHYPDLPEYHRKRAGRRRNAAAASALVGALAQPGARGVGEARDALLGVVPGKVKGAVFDWVMEASLRGRYEVAGHVEAESVC